MTTFRRPTLFYVITILIIISVFFISGLGRFPQKEISLDYNRFRIRYADLLYSIEENSLSFHEEHLIQQLKNEKLQLCLYDLSTHTIIFSYGTNVSDIKTHNIENYLVHDQSMENKLNNGSYLMNHIFFQDNIPALLGIFIVEKNLIFSKIYTGQAILFTRYTGLLFILLLLTIGYIYLIKTRIITPLKALEGTTKRIASGNFTDEVSYELQHGSLSSCYIELDHMRKDLQEFSRKLRENELNRKELMNYLTHDLKTPLASIRALCEGLIDGVASTPEKKERYLNGILNKTNEMERLSNDLFHHANIELNGFSVHKTEDFIDDIFSKIFASCEIVLESFEGEYTFKNELPHMIVNADPFRLEQAVITNAAKYSKIDNNITLHAYYNDPFFIIIIKDSGMGISKEDLPFIFDPFFRGEKSRSRKYGGTGLGLSIVKHIIERHQGKITVRSSLNKGTTFTISIPKG
jgi:signal transduction histidine kinase